MAEDKKEPSKETEQKKEKKSLSERFNFAKIKRKAIVGSLVTAFATVTVGGVALTKYSYDQTERTVTFQLEKLSDKKTIVQTKCTQKRTTRYKLWDSNYFSDMDDSSNFEDATIVATPNKCEMEVLDRVINTSEGVFKNNPSFLNFKDEDDVALIDRNLKAGVWYEAKIKGYDSNIISLKRLPPDWQGNSKKKVKQVAPKKEEAVDSIKAKNNGDINLEELERQLKILKIQQELDKLKNKRDTMWDKPPALPSAKAPNPKK